jgi:hypothetical protein
MIGVNPHRAMVRTVSCLPIKRKWAEKNGKRTKRTFPKQDVHRSRIASGPCAFAARSPVLSTGVGLGLKNVWRCNGNGMEKKNSRDTGKQPIQG